MQKPSLENARLIVGTLNFSSWSIRPWFLMKHYGVPFEVEEIFMFRDGWKEKILNHSPVGTVPILKVGDLTLPDSLAICEYLAEALPEHPLWPKDVKARALARCVAAEMHSGFSDLRTMMPMDIVNTYPGVSRYPGVEADVARIKALWQSCLDHGSHEGPFLFGEFGIADAMFVPVISRFKTYGVALEGDLLVYAQAVQELPAYKEMKDVARISFEKEGRISHF